MDNFTLEPLENTFSLEPVEEPEQEPRGKYTANDLGGDDIPVIRDYMVTMEGNRMNELADDDLIEKFINRQRGFAAGNSVRAGNELVRLSQLDDEQLGKVGAAYSLFNNMEGIFSEENTWGETLEGVKDYARTTLLDPANLIGLGVGKAVGAGASKSAVRIAQNRAMAIFQKEVAKGVTREAAEKTASKVFAAAAKEVAGKEATNLLSREAARKGATEAAKKQATKSMLKQTGAVVATDTLINVGTELAYQKGMIMAGEEENYNKFSLGIAALGTIALGGISAGLAGRNISNMTVANPADFVPTPKEAGQVVSQLGDTLGKMVKSGDWKDKVAKGKELTDLDFDFWRTMLLGDKEKDIKGLSSILAEEGYVWQRRDDQDKVSNWIADIIKSADPQDAAKFVDNFESSTGIKMTDLKGEMTEGGIDAFANVFARKMNQAGVTMNAVSQIARFRGVDASTLDPSKLSLTDYGEALGVFGTGKKVEKERWQNMLGEGVSRFQNNTIRMIVSNLSTTNLNVVGWGLASAQNSMSDFAMAVFHSGKSFAHLVTMNPKEAIKAAEVTAAIGQNQFDKIRFLLDTDATVDVFKSLALVRGDAMRELTDILPGGVEDLSKVLKNRGFDPNMTKFGVVQDAIVDGVQIVNLVKAQDILTKAVEYNSQLDKALRMSKWRVSLRDLMKAPDKAKIMNTEDFARMEAKAIYETQRAIFSKSYKGQGFLGEVAGMIEDARNIPGIGLLVPFGRFFNNTIATTADAVGVSSLYKLIDKSSTPERTMGELLSRAAVTVGGVYSIAQVEQENREKGLAWYEVEDETTGGVTDRRYDFPYSLWKGMGHIVSYWIDDQQVPAKDMAEIADVFDKYGQAEEGLRLTGEIPPELLDQMGQAVFGQLTRQLTESSDSIYQMGKAILSGEATKDDLSGLLTRPATQIVSGWTRYLEPLNVAIGVANATDFTLMDRKQGNKVINDMFRYTDQFSQLFKEGGPQKFNAVDGPAKLDPSKFAGARNAGPVTDTERVLNTLGKPYWKLNSFSMDPAADNRFNALFNSIIEDESNKLIKNDKFKNGSLEERNFMWSTVLTKAKDMTKKYMEGGINKTGDRALALTLEISAAGQAKVDTAMAELGYEDITELTPKELEILKGLIDTRDDFLKQKTK